MSTRYFQNVMSEARRRFPIDYLSVNAHFENDGSLTFDVHLTLARPNQEDEAWPKSFDMVHMAGSKHSLTASIVELVRRSRFENDLEQEMEIEYEDIPLPRITDETEPLVSQEIADMIAEGGPAGDST